MNDIDLRHIIELKRDLDINEVMINAFLKAWRGNVKCNFMFEMDGQTYELVTITTDVCECMLEQLYAEKQKILDALKLYGFNLK